VPGPLTYAEAIKIAQGEGPTGIGPEARLLHGHALLTIQSYEMARNELVPLERILPAGPLRARADIDLVHLAAYLDGDGAGSHAERAVREIGADPLLLADLHLGLSLGAMRASEIRRAVDALCHADDALRAAKPSRESALLRARVERQLAVVRAQAAEYWEARAAADRAQALCDQSADQWEHASCQYTAAYVDWLSGSLTRARDRLAAVERKLLPSGCALRRSVLLCLAHVCAELDRPVAAERFGNESGIDSPEFYAFLALARNDAALARRILEGARASLPAEVTFHEALSGLVAVADGQPRAGAHALAEAEEAFRARGQLHFALGCAVHRSYAMALFLPGAGRGLADRTAAELRERGALAFAWYRPIVAAWLAHTRQPQPKIPAITTADDQQMSGLLWRCRERGLTWREIEVLRAIQTSTTRTRQRRGQLASDLGISANTLRVHLWRIRQKLEVRRRGDAPLLSALGWPFEDAETS
jgi:ATP/maltotriose-dependent transcriptional regulator MalT